MCSVIAVSENFVKLACFYNSLQNVITHMNVLHEYYDDSSSVTLKLGILAAFIFSSADSDFIFNSSVKLIFTEKCLYFTKPRGFSSLNISWISLNSGLLVQS